MASKARLMRWVKPKSKRANMEAPDWVKAEWAKGDKNAIADLYVHCNFNREPCTQKHSTQELCMVLCMVNLESGVYTVQRQEELQARLTIAIKKKQIVELTVNEGWYSVKEMLNDLKWSQ